MFREIVERTANLGRIVLEHLLEQEQDVSDYKTLK